tara:strand:+ start:600 stop:1022 length:423 start_codon:yes stop_codon:yes gene_type:complete
MFNDGTSNNNILINDKDTVSNVIELVNDEIIYIDNMIAGMIYVRSCGIWKKKFFVLSDNTFEYWKSNKQTKNGRVRVKERYFDFDHKFELSCLNKTIHHNKLCWTFKLYRKDKLFLYVLSYNENMEKIYNKIKNRLYFID